MSITARGSATASSVAALMEGVGSAAVTATFNECKNSEVIIVTAQPNGKSSGGRHLLQAGGEARRHPGGDGPSRAGAQRHAAHMLQFKIGTDVAMLNA